MTYMWNLKKENKGMNIIKPEQTNRHREQTRGYQWGKWVKVVKRYKLSVTIREISSDDVLYIMVTVVNNTVLHV